MIKLHLARPAASCGGQLAIGRPAATPAARVLVVVERGDDSWRLEIWTPFAPRGRCTHTGNRDRLIAIAADMATAADEVHILPCTASDWYDTTSTYSGAPKRKPRD